MNNYTRILFCLTFAMAAACSNQKAPAHKMLTDIQAATNAAQADAAKWVPDQLKDVQGKLGNLQGSYDKGDYKAVLNDGPAALSAAQQLETEATTKRDQVTQSLTSEWNALMSSVPAESMAIAERVEFLGKPKNRKLASGVDLDAARNAQTQAAALWSKAQQAFMSGDLANAVTTGQSAKSAMDAVAASMKLDLKQPAAVKDTTLAD